MALAQATLRLSINATETKTLDLVTPQSRLAINKVLTLAAGTGLNQADRIYHDQRTLAASGTENLDLSDALLDVFGDLVVFARIKAIYVFAATANTNNVVVGGHATAAWPFLGAVNDLVPLKPGEWFAKAIGSAVAWPVTATTADMLMITNSAAGTSVVYDIVLIGASA